MAESLYTSLCFDDDSCNTLNSDFRPKHYDSSILKLPTMDDVKDELMRQMNLSWLDRLKEWIRNQAGYLSFTVLAYNIVMLTLHIVDFCTNNNPNNMFRLTFSLIWRLTKKLAKFCARKQKNQPSKLNTSNSHWNQSSGSTRSNNLELQPNNLDNFAISHIT